jgi:hypothetical protein
MEFFHKILPLFFIDKYNKAINELGNQRLTTTMADNSFWATVFTTIWTLVPSFFLFCFVVIADDTAVD